ncbi:MAG TPA: L,D-transpeptidase family protein [Ferruginibacter sp.]|nr:L,D-transpeptidase family protein [Ferruginibacter sp.]
MYNPKGYHLYFTVVIILLFIACNDEPTAKKRIVNPRQIVTDPKSMNAFVKENIIQLLSIAIEKNKKIDDSDLLIFLNVVNNYYETNDHVPVWSSMGKLKSLADSLIHYLASVSYDGLYREDYHYDRLVAWQNTFQNDSLVRMNAEAWAKTDLLLTDAFMHLVQDLKQGRLQDDSITWKNDTILHRVFFRSLLDKMVGGETISSIAEKLQPSFQSYINLKKMLPGFLDSMDTNYYTYLKYPYKDSLTFIKNLIIRLGESGIISNPGSRLDSLQLSEAIKKYERGKGIKTTGKITKQLISKLNMSDREKFNRIAITLDKYKKLPPEMPDKYIWVNLPAYYLAVWEKDSMIMRSKIICGKPATPTPILTSAITDMVIYPTWTVPASIIKKEMLPALKKSTGYLAKKGLHLLNEKGEAIDPATVNWAKYSKGIPYKIQQGSGDDNALGVIKFNFSNPFSVYLHDTNQRYLFRNSVLSLSHGCVRVQEWKKLAFYILRNDSMQIKKKDSLMVNTDSITSWIAQKEKHRINITYKIPLFIRYFGCEATNGTIQFYDDIYGDDRLLRERYFAGK